jgi:hypothetical protein
MDSALLLLERHAPTGADPDARAQETVATSHSGRSSVVAPRQPFKAVRDKILHRAAELACLGVTDGTPDIDQTLALCGTLSEDLAEDMRQQAAQDPDALPWVAAFEEAADNIMLMTLENDTRSAADAVTILLQLRRELDQLEIH